MPHFSLMGATLACSIDASRACIRAAALKAVSRCAKFASCVFVLGACAPARCRVVVFFRGVPAAGRFASIANKIGLLGLPGQRFAFRLSFAQVYGGATASFAFFRAPYFSRCIVLSRFHVRAGKSGCPLLQSGRFFVPRLRFRSKFNPSFPDSAGEREEANQASLTRAKSSPPASGILGFFLLRGYGGRGVVGSSRLEGGARGTVVLSFLLNVVAPPGNSSAAACLFSKKSAWVFSLSAAATDRRSSKRSFLNWSEHARADSTFWGFPPPFST